MNFEIFIKKSKRKAYNIKKVYKISNKWNKIKFSIILLIFMSALFCNIPKLNFEI